MKRLNIVLGVVILSLSGWGENKIPKNTKDQAMTTKTLTWFELKNCETLEINDFAQAIAKKPVRTKIITDKLVITRLRTMIEELPPEGSMMKSFSEEVPMVVLVFKCGDHSEEIEFYRGKIKTPSTGFYGNKNDKEDKIFTFIQDHLKN